MDSTNQHKYIEVNQQQQNLALVIKKTYDLNWRLEKKKKKTDKEHVYIYLEVQ